MIGVLGNILPDILHAGSKGDSVCAAFRIFKTLLSIPDHYSNTALLQQPRDLRARFWPLSRRLQTKPRPLGLDSLFIACSLYKKVSPFNSKKDTHVLCDAFDQI